MTEQEALALKKKVADLEAKVGDLQEVVIVLLQHESRAARASVRRMKNMSDRDENRAELFEGLLGELKTTSE